MRFRKNVHPFEDQLNFSSKMHWTFQCKKHKPRAVKNIF